MAELMSHVSAGLGSLRPAKPDDAELLLAIYSSTRTAELAQVPWSDAQKEQFLRMQFEAQSKWYTTNYPGADFQIILVHGQPAGRLYVHRREKEIRVMDLALLPEFRGRGMGTELLNQILEEGRRTNRPVTINVESFNPAQRLYARLGFRQVGTNGIYHLLEWSGPSITGTEIETCAPPTARLGTPETTPSLQSSAS